MTNAEQLDINLVEHMISDPQLARFVETKEDKILPELQKLICLAGPSREVRLPQNYRSTEITGMSSPYAMD